MELDLLRVAPLDAVQAALRALQPLGRAVEIHAERHERRVAQEDQPPAGSQEARRLGDPAMWIRPDRGAVLRVDDVERLVGKRNVLAVRFDQGELETRLLL